MTRAAERLHRVPSNVTTRIKQLEQRLGVALLRRQGRSLALLMRDARCWVAERLLQMADLAEQELRSGVVRGVLRLGSLKARQARGCRPSCQPFTLNTRTSRLSCKPAQPARYSACSSDLRSRLPSSRSPSTRAAFLALPS